MLTALALAETQFLQQTDLNQAHLEQALSLIMQHQVDYADLYFQHNHTIGWSIEDGLVKEASFNLAQGVGVRVVTGEKTGFAYSDDIHQQALLTAAKTARGIAKQGGEQKVCAWAAVPNHANLYLPQSPLPSMSDPDKVALLQQIDAYARHLDSRVTQVMASIVGAHDVVMVAASDGTYQADVRPLVRLNVTVIAADGDTKEQGFAGGGGRRDFQYFLEDERWKSYVEEAVRVAVLNLDAVEMPAGTMDVVLGSGWPGVLLHEAIGHGLEGDFNRKKTSSFSHLMGKKVASPLCTIVDNGAMPGRRGSLNMDDEGTPTQETVLIEKGVLTAYMQDKLNARLMKTQSTGNARRESYADIPMPRMTNTYMLPGESDPQEILASIDKGLYAVNFSGGQVDITSGKFVFVVNEAYWIEKGKIQYPVKGATLIGDGPTALHQVSMVGNDLALDTGIGVCGKEGQSVPVGVGQPTLRINGLTVGGTGA